jgi:hypothetical protein
MVATTESVKHATHYPKTTMDKKPRTKTVRLFADTADLAYQLAPILGNGDVADLLEPLIRPQLEKLRQKAIEKLSKGGRQSPD